jgi:hypothetical protein
MRNLQYLVTGLVASFCLSFNAQAAIIDINLAPNSIANDSYAMQRNYAAGGLSLGVTGWSNGIITTCTCSKYKKMAPVKLGQPVPRLTPVLNRAPWASGTASA